MSTTLRQVARALNPGFRRYQWNVGLIDAPIESFLEDKPVSEPRWLADPDRGEFFADPFYVPLKSGDSVICERFDYWTGLGTIAVLPLEFTPDRCLRSAMERPVHLSYPYTFEFAGDIFCVPEMSAQRQVELFRANGAPDRWSFVQVLLESVAAVDPTIFHYDGRWWLFCTDADRGADSALCAWHASSPLGPWTAHPRNPVKVDRFGGRPGGTPFAFGGRLYRPAQDCTRSYGGGLVIQRVDRLTMSDFAETPVAMVRPSSGWRFGDGVHTLSAAGRRTIVDARRLRVVPAAFRDGVRDQVRAVARFLGSGGSWRTDVKANA